MIMSMNAILLKTETISAIGRDVAQVLFAGLFIEPIAGGKMSVLLLVSGFILSVVAWTISLLLAKA